jgi:A/G-specific adenine glycosylase
MDQLGIRMLQSEPLPQAKHIFSHVVWHMRGYHVEAQKPLPVNDFVWVTADELTAGYSMPTAFRVYKKVLSRTLK